MTPKEIVGKFVEAFNNKDVDALCLLYADEAVNHQVAEEPCVGLAAIRKMFAESFEQAEMVCIVENIFEDGDYGILEWSDPLGLRGCGFFKTENDKIIFQRGYWDKLSFLRQHKLPLPKE